MSEAAPLSREIADLPPGPLPDAPPGWVIRGVLALRGWLLRLVDGITPPEAMVFERATGMAFTSVLGTFARLRVADLLDASPVTSDALAAKLATDPDATFRMLHAMASIGLVDMQPGRSFSANARTRALRSEHPSRARDFAEYFASGSNVAAWQDFEATLRSGRGAFERVHGVSVWDWFDAHPGERECFAQAMMGLTLGVAPIIASTYPFKEVGSVCDVSGGRGTLVSEILVRHPHLRATLTDGAGVLASARTLLSHRGVLDRTTLTEANFFDALPSGAEVYTLKNVLHDWDDARSAKILRNVRAAMQPGQRVLVLESLLDRSRPDPLVAPSDLHMMMVCGDGRERDVADFHRLFAETGFAPGRTWEHPIIGLVEGIAR